jgi:aminopeptidase YwaD
MPEPFRRPGILIPLILTLVIGCAPRTSGLASPAASRSPSAAVGETSVRAHMEFLASDALNGRGSGTRDEWIAVTYVAAQLRQWGLEPMGDNGSYVQTIAIDRPELAAAPVLTAGDRRYTHGKEITVTSMNAPSMSGTIADVKSGESAAAGTVVVIPEFTRALAPSLAKAELVLANANGCGGFRGQQGGLPRVAPTTVGAAAAPARPTCVGLDAQTFAAVEKLPAGTRVSLEAPVKQTQRTHTWNAVGRLAGNGPRANDEVILLSAHIDHLGTGRPSASSGQAAAAGDTIYNGADDDASGSVAVLELAQAMASGRRARRTVVFAWFGSEESGGAGARYFADKPVVPLDHIVANLQFEMIGRPDAKVPAHTLWLTRALDAGARTRETRREAGSGSTPRAELLRAVGQHSVRPPRRRRAHGIELRAAQGLPPGVG